MKNIILCALLAISLTGCGWISHKAKHLKSGVIGLKRVITLYANSGLIIREWEGKYQVEVDGASARFIDNGKAVTISGTFIIEEIK